MGKQQSQKHGLRSSAQKEDRARGAYDPVPPSKPVGGAFGNPASKKASDEEVSLLLDEKRAKKKKTKSRVISSDE